MGRRRLTIRPLRQRALATRLNELGYEVDTAQDQLQTLSGVVVEQAAELDELAAANAELRTRVAILESRSTTTLTR